MQNMSGKSALGLDANVVAMLCYVANICCYLGLILSIITVVTDKTNKLARFHAFQSILLSAVGIVLAIAVNILSVVAAAAHSSVISLGISGLFFLVGIGMLIAVIYTAIQAYSGNLFKLPVIGDLADKWSN